jgi:hypothetical protein
MKRKNMKAAKQAAEGCLGGLPVEVKEHRSATPSCKRWG